MSKPSKNLISATQDNLQDVFKGLSDFDLFEDRAALELFLNASQSMVEIIEQKRAKLREEEKIKSCKNLVMARRPYGTKRELIPACMRAGADPELCGEKCDYSNAASEKSQGFKYALIGPQGIGKSKHSAAFADALGATRVLDDGYDWPDDLESAFVENTLLINNSLEDELLDDQTILFQVQSENQILALIKALQPSAA